jgi:hypothetical protein
MTKSTAVTKKDTNAMLNEIKVTSGRFEQFN